MRSIIDKSEKLANSASFFFANVAAIILLLLVGLTCVDVIGRYLFSSPLVGAVILLITILVAYKIGDRVFDYAVRAHEDKDVTEYLAIPRWPIVGFITLSIFAAAITTVLRLLVLLSRPGEVLDETPEDGL